jgi:DNA-damage-inducible protein D
MDTKIAVFRGKEIRKILFESEGYFSIVDIIAVLTDSDKPRDYWYRMKQREKQGTGTELSTLCRQLKLESADGKKYQTGVVNTENAFRILQSTRRPERKANGPF